MSLGILVSLFSNTGEIVPYVISLATSPSWFKVSDVKTGLSHVSLSILISLFSNSGEIVPYVISLATSPSWFKVSLHFPLSYRIDIKIAR